MASVFLVVMLILFGASWPAATVKAYRAKTAKGTSLLFLSLVFTGYIFGIAANVLDGPIYVTVVYLVNLSIVGANIALYFRNRSLDVKRARETAEN